MNRWRGCPIGRPATSDNHLTKLESDENAWTGLLTWLRDVHGMKTGQDDLRVRWAEAKDAGRGLIALGDTPAVTPLFSVPTSALINSRTLAPYFPPKSLSTPNSKRAALTAVQAISLYLAAHRNDPTSSWAPYIRVLPADFDDHPINLWLLTQGVGRVREDLKAHQTALSLGPPSLLLSLHAATARCMTDFHSVTAFITKHPGLFGQMGLEDFVWGWLNANTRQVWMSLGLSKEDNITLAPIFDMCNHTSGRGGELSLASNERSLSLRVPYPLKPGEEVCIQYGAHDNITLLVEYGFVLGLDQTQTWAVPVADLVLPMFHAQGKCGDEKLNALEVNGFHSKHFALHFCPKPSSPSYGLIVALRLLHSPAAEDGYAAWFQALWGDVRFGEINPDIDQKVQDTLYHVCAEIVGRATSGVVAMRDVKGRRVEDVRALWHGEKCVAIAVEATLRCGEIDFD